ncbi:CTR2 long splice variant [Apiospora arundinis]
MRSMNHHFMDGSSGGGGGGDCHGGMHQAHQHAAAPMDHHKHDHHHHHHSGGEAAAAAAGAGAGHQHHNHNHHHHHGHDHASSGSGMCSMNMYLNADVTDVCILHERWHVTDARSFAGSLVLCAFLVALYERFAAWRRRYATSVARQAKAAARKKELSSSSSSSSASGEKQKTGTSTCHSTTSSVSAMERSRRRRAAAINAALYGVGYLWGMTNMLIFMTFNVWVMLACGVGAAVGKFLSGDDEEGQGEEEKEASCH